MFDIREGTKADWPDVLEMSKKFYQMGGYPVAIPLHEPSMEKLYDMILEQGFLYVATVEGKPVAMLGCLLSPYLLNHNFLTSTEIMWWVDENHRGGSMAIRLKDKAEQRAKAEGCVTQVMTKLANSGPQVEKMYLHSGYREIETAFIKEL